MGDRSRFAVAILAGGGSRRMGTDKAALTLGGGTLLGRAAHAAAEAGASAVFVVGRERPAEWDGPDVTNFVPDPPARAGQGPLAGIVTALEEAERQGIPNVIAVACDMPWLSADALRWLRSVPADEHGVAALGEDGAPEPLFALYRTAAALPLFAGCLGGGERSPRRCTGRGRFSRAEVPPHVRAALTDVDTPEQFAAAQEKSNGDPLLET